MGISEAIYFSFNKKIFLSIWNRRNVIIFNSYKLKQEEKIKIYIASFGTKRTGSECISHRFDDVRSTLWPAMTTLNKRNVISNCLLCNDNLYDVQTNMEGGT